MVAEDDDDDDDELIKRVTKTENFKMFLLW